MAAAAQAMAGRSANLARQGVDTISAAMKIVSDLTAQEISMVIGMIRERVNMRPGASILDIGSRAMTGIMGAEKIMLDLVAGETAIMAEGVKQVFGLRTSAAAIVDLVPKGVETYVGMGQSFLDDTIEQTEEIAESYGDGKPLMVGDRMKRFARARVECFVDGQKKFLDQVNEQVAIATEPGSEEAIPVERYESNRLVHLAREGADKFFDAEKKMAHLLIAHIETAKPKQRKVPPRTSVAEMTQKSVYNITSAQKSLLDLAMKPIRESEDGGSPREEARRAAREEPRRAARRPAKRKR